jgi:hypothetical protein
MSDNPITRYAVLRRRLTQPVTVTTNVRPAFVELYDYAVQLQTALHQALNAGELPAADDELDPDRIGRY